jgi:hypothetical protein
MRRVDSCQFGVFGVQFVWFELMHFGGGCGDGGCLGGFVFFMLESVVVIIRVTLVFVIVLAM